MTIEGSRIFISGGSGSLGKALTTRLLTMNPSRVVIYSRGEHLQESMERELGCHSSLRFYIGDVRDYDRLEMATQDIDYIVHAAAMKVIPKCERDPIEAINTNVMGTANIIRAAIRNKVKKSLLISSDKMCSPINLYGATKQAAEKLFIAAHNIRGSNPTLFSVARYGNVWGSKGSVIPLFKRLKAEGKEFLPVTDDRMTRFIITMDEAVSFVIDCIQAMEGDEIFIPKLPSASILDIVDAFDMPHRILGIRPGEKLHETLITRDESRFAHFRSSSNSGFVIRPYSQESLEKSTWEYTSDKNDQWIVVDRLRDMLTL